MIEMKKAIAILMLLFVAATGSAQNELYDEPVVIYSNQHYGGLQLNTNGYGAYFNFGINKGAYKVRLFTFDLSFVKHEKEARSYSSDPNARAYFYGKQNNLYVLRTGIGDKKIIAEKLRKNGVQISRCWSAGPLLGFTKPVYLEIVKVDEQLTATYYLETERFDPDKHYPENIYGRASGLRGLGEMKVHPGVFFRYGYNFEYSNYKDGLKGLEVGAALDVYPKKIEIMSEKILETYNKGATNHQFFLSLYVNLFFGRKYNKD